MDKIMLLVGNPNSGKSTFFNSATKAEEHVGNWHGVTVDYKEKKFKLNGRQITLTDLPGAYSLSPYSFEEAITRDYVYSHKNSGVINIIDGNNIGRNLVLTLELLELGIKPTLCINMANELKKDKTTIDCNKLQNILGTQVFLINAQNKKQCQTVISSANKSETQSYNKVLPYIANLVKKFDSLNIDFGHKILTNYQKIKILEQDEYMLQKFDLDNQKTKKVLNDADTLQYVFLQRFEFIKDIIRQCINKQNPQKIYGFGKFDKFALNKFFALPIFAVIMALVFALTFGTFGSKLSQMLSTFFDNCLLTPISKILQKNVKNAFVLNFVTNALFGSIVSLVSFLPQIILMFLGLYVLEDSGYMSRIAFVFEDFLKKVGLSGKSVFTLLMSFGCSATATLTSRNLENKNSKIKTAMLTPYVSCSAKLPIYSIVCGAFFPKHKLLVIVLLYLLGIVVSLAVSYFLNKTILKSDDTNFVMELPKYRFPSIKKIIKNIWINIKQFFLRVGTVLLSFSCIIWLLQNCNFRLEYGVGDSMLKSISQFVAPLFAPLGFGNAGAVSTLLCGFVAKEIIVSTISILNGLGGAGNLMDISNSLLLSTSAFYLTKSSSVSFLTFALLYIPCLSTVSSMVKEIGKKWTLFACAIQFLVAYAISFVAFKVANYFVVNGALAGVISLFVFLFICASIVVVKKIFSKKKFCKFCPKNKNCQNYTK